ncbi:major strawberry allergen Fra a 1.07-like [Syzygium oleosum]|uniref:major strawberry allergen Fra a 1.07-like n=1 Tax=Syzygium oleosum TaxID=219896 RepID=UPI0011D24779|nr:major strawberry allergen Fra a 1.07-like [Syzygium oleosum]
MGLVTHETEITLSIPPAQVVEALVEANNLIPKVLLPVIKRTEVVEEETSSEGSRYKTVKHKVEAPDEENFIYCCSIVEGDKLANTYEKMSHEVKITASPEGGSVCKNTSVYFTDGEVDNTEEKIKAWKERAFGMVKTIEAYLVGNPHD